MSTFTLPNSAPECPVHLTEDITKDQLLNFPAFKNWINTLQSSLKTQENANHTFHDTPYKLRKIDVQAVDIFGGKRIGFIKLKAEITNDDGEYSPGAVFLRGGSVAMLLILQPDDVPASSETDKHVLLAVQPRIAAGSLAFAEIPAGMLDDSGSFSGGAAKEIEEETGSVIKDEELVDMTSLTLSAAQDPHTETGEKSQKAVYPSPGGSDEFIPIFLWQKRIPREHLREWQGKLTGSRDHGEKITLKVVRLEELWREGARDGKTLAAWALYEGLRKEGKI